MTCPRCRTEVPDVAHFCQRCGQDQRGSAEPSDRRGPRRTSFAARPDEPVASFALISTIMPRGVGQRPQTYRIALLIALTVALVAAIFGLLPIAVLVAAFAIPIVYIVYLYDVNLWEDEPIPVTALAFALTGLLAVGFTILWTNLRGDALGGGQLGGAGATPMVGTVLLVVLVVPVVGEVIKQIGPLVLASRPEFDDLMDGLTFGVISGVAYATFDTIVKHWALLTGGSAGLSDPGLWASLIFLEGFVKPLIFGTATGIACAEFSGLGRGYDGFTPRYFRGLGEAVLANVAYQAGSYFFGFLPTATLSVIVTLIWGVLILGVLILRVRNVLHTGLMEAALERSAREGGVGEHGELQFCAQCEMPLLDHAAFCNACGTAVRVQPKSGRAALVAAVATATGAPSVAGSGGSAAHEQSIATPSAVREPVEPPTTEQEDRA